MGVYYNSITSPAKLEKKDLLPHITVEYDKKSVTECYLREWVCVCVWFCFENWKRQSSMNKWIWIRSKRRYAHINMKVSHNICVGEMKYGKIGEIKLSRYVTYILFCIQARSHNTHENKGTNRRRHKHYTFLFGVWKLSLHLIEIEGKDTAELYTSVFALNTAVFLYKL